MRILFYHAAREWTGTARVIAVAARGLAQRGNSVSIVVEQDSSVEQGIRRYTGSSEADTASGRGESSVEIVPFAARGGWFDRGRALKNLFRRWDLDVVVVHTDEEHAVAALACRLGGRGTVLRRTPPGIKLDLTGFSRWPTRLAPTHLLFSSESDVRAAALPARAPASTVAEVGVDATGYERADGGNGEGTGDAQGLRYIICVYDPTSRGRAATAIRTVSMLSPRHPYLRLVIFGAGSDDEDLRMQAAALDMLNLVTLLGERDDHIALMRGAELGWVVAEGDTAAFGILDLAALGIPVIAASNTVASRFIADGISGVLLPPDDTAMTAARVVSLLSNGELREGMGNAARSRVTREFSEERMIDGFERAATAARAGTRSTG